MSTVLTLDPTLLELNRKLDYLTEQVACLTEEVQQQRQRRQTWEGWQEDLSPVLNDVMRLSVHQLEEIEGEFQIEDLIRLLKRLLRQTRNLEQLLDQLEGGLEMWQDVSPLSREAFLTLLERLGDLERKGYFVFFNGGLDIIERIVTSFNEEDVRQLGENIVLILQTIKEMTQPEIMNFMRNTAMAVKEEEPADVSLLSIVRQLNDPAVKKGLAKTLNVLKSVAETKN